MFEALHFQYFLGGLVSLITITNPPSKMPLFISLTQGMSEERRRQQANWAGIYAAAIMLVSLVCGNVLLAFFGISYGAMRIARSRCCSNWLSNAFGVISEQSADCSPRPRGLCFFPIAMPGIAGPGTIAVVIGFSTEIAELPGYIDMAIAFAWTALAILRNQSLMVHHALFRCNFKSPWPLRNSLSSVS